MPYSVQFYSTTAETRVTHTGDTSYSTAATLTFTPPEAFTAYCILAFPIVDIDATGTLTTVRLRDVTGSADLITPTTRFQVLSQRRSYPLMTIWTSGASPPSQSFTIDYKCSNAAKIAGIQGIDLQAFLVDATMTTALSAAEATHTGDTNWTTKTSITLGAGAYDILAYAEVGSTAAAATSEVRLYDGTTTFGACSPIAIISSANSYPCWFHIASVAPSGSTTYSIDYRDNAGANTAKIRNACLISIPKGRWPWRAQAEQRTAGSHTGDTTAQTFVTLTATPEAQPTLTLACSVDGYSSAANAHASELNKAAATVFATDTATTAIGAFSAFARGHLVTEAGTSNTWLTKYACGNSADTLTYDECTILAVGLTTADARRKIVCG